MVIAQRYDVIDMKKGQLDRRVFTDEHIYQEELEKIFSRTWQFIGHESQIPNPNDFFLAYMGEDPVILTRDSKGKVRAFLNMCMHRGNRIVRADKGNAKSFMCAYHGWTFSNEGKLVSVPGFQEAYYGELPIEKLGLVEARVESYAGGVFANWDPEAPDLGAYLGDMRYYLDVRFNARDNGLQYFGPVKWMMPCNWKAPVENAIGDNHHGIITHASSALVQARFRGGDNKVYLSHKDRFLQPGRQVYAGNGHGMQALVSEKEMGGSRRNNGLGDWNNIREIRMQYEESKLAETERRLGRFRAQRVRPGNSCVFPNLFLGTALALPRGPRNTEVWSWVETDKDEPEVLKRHSVLHHPQASASHLASVHAQDDMNNWQQVTDSGRYMAVRHYPQNINMGVGHDVPGDEKMPAVSHSQTFCSENNHRGYYQWWQTMMNANSWKDIPVAPTTAKFEGTATLRG